MKNEKGRLLRNQLTGMEIGTIHCLGTHGHRVKH